MSARGTLAGAFLAVVVAMATGCAPANDLGAKNFRVIERTAIKQMRSLDSLRMNGSIMSDGGSMDLDLALDSKGNCTGSVTTDGVTAHFKSSGKSSFIKGSRSFWATNTGSEQAAAQIMAVVGNKWAKLPAQSADMGAMCDLDKVLEELTKDEPGSKGSKGEVTDVLGESAVELVYRKGKETTIVWVATESPHNVLKIEATGGKQPGRLSFSGFDETVDIALPTEKQFVDLGKL